MLACLVLGMGIPTIPNYIITSSIAGPALLHLEVPLLVSHMFVFYFGIMADLTPPVALAAFAAAPIARESGMKIGMQAIRIAVAGFAVPFMAVYEPVIMLQEGGPLTEKIRLLAGLRVYARQGAAEHSSVGRGGHRTSAHAPPAMGAYLGICSNRADARHLSL